MSRYHITSKSGTDYGIHEGATAAHALAALHRKAGYKVSARTGRLAFASETDREVAGDVEDWRVVEVCGGPGCEKPARARGLCVGHLWQEKNHGELSPLRVRGDGSRVVLSLRVEPGVKTRALEDPDGARKALSTWARR